MIKFSIHLCFLLFVSFVRKKLIHFIEARIQTWFFVSSARDAIHFFSFIIFPPLAAAFFLGNIEMGHDQSILVSLIECETKVVRDTTTNLLG